MASVPFRPWSFCTAAVGLALWCALAIDSLGPRGRANACLSGEPDQPLDAYAGLNFLAAQDFVDSDRIGVLGYSMGGGSALVVAERELIEQLFHEDASADALMQTHRFFDAYLAAGAGR